MVSWDIQPGLEWAGVDRKIGQDFLNVKQGFCPQHYWHFRPDRSWLWRASCTWAAALTSPHHNSLAYFSPSLTARNVFRYCQKFPEDIWDHRSKGSGVQGRPESWAVVIRKQTGKRSRQKIEHKGPEERDWHFQELEVIHYKLDIAIGRGESGEASRIIIKCLPLYIWESDSILKYLGAIKGIIHNGLVS